MMKKKPYFLKNEKWWVFNKEECRYELTEYAPRKAVKSYDEFYKPKTDKDGNLIFV